MKPQRRQRVEDDDDESSTSSLLQSSSTVEEFIAALQQIVANNDSSDRSEENVSIILNSKIQIIFSNRTNQDLLQALGEFFMWMMPSTESLTGAEREAEEEQEERGRIICSSRDFEDFMVHHLLRYAESSDAIFSLCRSVGRVASTNDNTCFMTVDARDELLKLVKNAPCEKSLQSALHAICNLAYSKKNGVPIRSNPFVCDEVSTIAYKLFCEATSPEIVQVAVDILRMQVARSTPQFFAIDPDFAQKMLHKLDETTETEAMWSIANLIGEVIYKKQGNRQLFASGEAARVFLSKLNSSEDPEVLRLICRCINNSAATLKNISGDFASPEMCRAIFKCFSKQEDEISKNDVMHSIAALTRKLPRARSTFTQECHGLDQVIIEMLTSATDDKTRCNAGKIVANISRDAESAKLLFNNVSLYEALIHAASRARSAEAKKSLIRAMENATSVCTDFLPLCAARYPSYDDRQIELLKLDSLDSLVSNLENNEWDFESSRAHFLSLRSILIVLEKVDQFLEDLDRRIEEGDPRVEEMLLTIAKGFDEMIQNFSELLFGDPVVDVTLSLLERSSGAANVVFVNVISYILSENPLLTICPSTVLRLLQKLDSSKELSERDYDGFKMDFDIYEILEMSAIRSPELFRDNNFLVDNSALIGSCFERSFEIHRFDANSSDKRTLQSHFEALCKGDPRMKENMEGWNLPGHYVFRRSGK